jgi:hypothetical protein
VGHKAQSISHVDKNVRFTYTHAKYLLVSYCLSIILSCLFNYVLFLGFINNLIISLKNKLTRPQQEQQAVFRDQYRHTMPKTENLRHRRMS